MKRLLSTVMILSLLLSQVLIAQAVDSAKASTLRLERTKGTVSLANQSKKPLSCLDGMKLLSGYTLSTNAASYAYVSLDENKAVKLDGLSAASIKQKGKKLELLLSSGKLFFDVKVPLASDETMEIRTSTMVTGIRGTAGVVQVLSPFESTLLLLSGHVETTSFDPVSRQIRKVQIQAGQLAYFTMHAGNPQPEVRIAPAQISDIPGFVAVEIASSPSLQTQIRNQTTLDVTALIAGAEKRLSDDETAQLERARLATAAIAAQTILHSTTPLFPASISSGGGGYSGPTVTTLNNVTDVRQIVAALNSYDIVKLACDFNLNAPLNVDAGKTLEILNSYTLNTVSGNTLNPLSIDGTVIVDYGATLINGSNYNLDPGIIINSTNSLDIAGTLKNDGLIHVGSVNPTNQAITPGKLSISSGGQAKNSGTILINPQSTLNSDSYFESLGSVNNSGSITSNTGIFLIDSRQYTGSGTLPPISMSYVNGNSIDTLYANTLSGILQNVPTGATLTLENSIDNTRIGSNPSLPSGKTITLKMIQKTINLGGFQLINAGNLTLIGDYESNIELSGESDDALIKNSGSLELIGWNLENKKSGPAIENLANTSAKLSIQGISKVTGSASSGVIRVCSGTFDMNDSSSILSTACGVFLDNGAIFTMNDGTIEAGTCGVVVSNGLPNKSTTFTMKNGTIGNDLFTAEGVSLSDQNCSFRMEGGYIQTSSVVTGVFAVNNKIASNFNFVRGTVQAKQSSSVCANPPQDYENSTTANNSWYSLVHK